MRLIQVVGLLVALLANVSGIRADFTGPSRANRAVSTNGDLLVRATPIETEDKTKQKFKISFYEFDEAVDGYTHRSHFELNDFLPNLMYVSDVGDLYLINLSEKSAIRLYTREGKLAASWKLADFLSPREIAGCMQTGSTLQWLDEAISVERRLYVYGPSHVVRALQPPYTIMRGYDENIAFTAVIDAETARLEKRGAEAEEEEVESGDERDEAHSDDSPEKPTD